MADVDIQKLYDTLKLIIKETANKLLHYIQMYSNVLNETKNNEKLTKLAKLYIVLNYFAETDIKDIDGKINADNVNTYTEQIYGANIQRGKLDAIQSTDLQGYFPSKEIISESHARLINYITQQNSLNDEYITNITILRQENEKLKAQVRQAKQQSPPPPLLNNNNILCNYDNRDGKLWDLYTNNLIDGVQLQYNQQFNTITQITFNNTNYIIYPYTFVTINRNDNKIMNLNNKPYDDNITYESNYDRYYVARIKIYIKIIYDSSAQFIELNRQKYRQLGTFINLSNISNPIKSKSNNPFIILEKI
jgi:hypothetical protein